MTRIGFTGTRHGMTAAQMGTFQTLLARLNPVYFHHGDCDGADVQAAYQATLLFPRCMVVCHPPVDTTHRAFSDFNDAMMPAKTHLARNRDIVNQADVVVACPPTKEHQPRGGTWYTIDYARKVGKPIYIIAPDGSLQGVEGKPR